MIRGNYEFQCNRCETRAQDSYRPSIELFTAHHMETVHPLFTAEATADLFRPKPKRRRIRSYRIAAAGVSS